MSRREKLVPAFAALVFCCAVAGCGQGSEIRSAASGAASSLPTGSHPAATVSRTADASPASPAGATTSEPSPTARPSTSRSAPAPTPSTTGRTSPAAIVPGASTAPPPASPAGSSTAASISQSGSSLAWLWILLGILAVALVAALIARHSRRSSARAAGWDAKVLDAYADGSALYDSMNLAQGPGGLAGGDADVRWADIQRRADDLTRELYELREQAPDDADRGKVGTTLVSLQALRSAMDAERIQGGIGTAQAERVRELLASFEASLRALRSPAGQGA